MFVVFCVVFENDYKGSACFHNMTKLIERRYWLIRSQHSWYCAICQFDVRFLSIWAFRDTSCAGAIHAMSTRAFKLYGISLES